MGYREMKHKSGDLRSDEKPLPQTTVHSNPGTEVKKEASRKEKANNGTASNACRTERQGPAHGVICDQEDRKMDTGELEFV